MDDLFGELVKEIEKEEAPENSADKFVARIEDEFIGGATPEQEDRQDERDNIEKKLAKYRRDLRGCKNIKNHRRTDANAKIGERRAKIKKKIEILELRLREIKLEEAEFSHEAVLAQGEREDGGKGTE